MPNLMSVSMTSGIGKKMSLLPRSRALSIMLFGVTLGVFSLFFSKIVMADPDQVVVQVRPNVQVAGNEIYLKDVAEITASAALKEKMGAIQLGPSPRPGKEKKILGRRLLSIVQAAKVMPECAKVTLPEVIQIERAFQSIKEEVLQQLFDCSVREGLAGSDFNVRQVKVCGANQFPAGKLSMSIPKGNNQKWAGNVNLRLQVQVNGEHCGSLTLSGWVDRFMPVVCTIREVKHHTVLTGEDLTLRPVNISTLSGELVTDMANAIGKQTRTTLRAGACLRSGFLEVAPLVQKGDRVKILAGSGQLNVSTIGIAKSSGGRGDQIQVENIVSNKIVVGRVTGESTVEVMF